MSLVPDIGNVWGDIPAWRQLEVLDYDPSDPLSIYQYFASQYGNILQWPGVADVPVTQYSDEDLESGVVPWWWDGAETLGGWLNFMAPALMESPLFSEYWGTDVTLPAQPLYPFSGDPSPYTIEFDAPGYGGGWFEFTPSGGLPDFLQAIAVDPELIYSALPQFYGGLKEQLIRDPRIKAMQDFETMRSVGWGLEEAVGREDFSREILDKYLGRPATEAGPGYGLAAASQQIEDLRLEQLQTLVDAYNLQISAVEDYVYQDIISNISFGFNEPWIQTPESFAGMQQIWQDMAGFGWWYDFLDEFGFSNMSEIATWIGQNWELGDSSVADFLQTMEFFELGDLTQIYAEGIQDGIPGVQYQLFFNGSPVEFVNGVGYFSADGTIFDLQGNMITPDQQIYFGDTGFYMWNDSMWSSDGFISEISDFMIGDSPFVDIDGTLYNIIDGSIAQYDVYGDTGMVFYGGMFYDSDWNLIMDSNQWADMFGQNGFDGIFFNGELFDTEGNLIDYNMFGAYWEIGGQYYSFDDDSSMFSLMESVVDNDTGMVLIGNELFDINGNIMDYEWIFQGADNEGSVIFANGMYYGISEGQFILGETIENGAAGLIHVTFPGSEFYWNTNTNEFVLPADIVELGNEYWTYGGNLYQGYGNDNIFIGIYDDLMSANEFGYYDLGEGNWVDLASGEYVSLDVYGDTGWYYIDGQMYDSNLAFMGTWESMNNTDNNTIWYVDAEGNFYDFDGSIINASSWGQSPFYLYDDVLYDSSGNIFMDNYAETVQLMDAEEGQTEFYNGFWIDDNLYDINGNPVDFNFISDTETGLMGTGQWIMIDGVPYMIGEDGMITVPDGAAYGHDFSAAFSSVEDYMGWYNSTIPYWANTSGQYWVGAGIVDDVGGTYWSVFDLEGNLISEMTYDMWYDAAMGDTTGIINFFADVGVNANLFYDVNNWLVGLIQSPDGNWFAFNTDYDEHSGNVGGIWELIGGLGGYFYEENTSWNNTDMSFDISDFNYGSASGPLDLSPYGLDGWEIWSDNGLNYSAWTLELSDPSGNITYWSMNDINDSFSNTWNNFNPQMHQITGGVPYTSDYDFVYSAGSNSNHRAIFTVYNTWGQAEASFEYNMANAFEGFGAGQADDLGDLLISAGMSPNSVAGGFVRGWSSSSSRTWIENVVPQFGVNYVNYSSFDSYMASIANSWGLGVQWVGWNSMAWNDAAEAQFDFGWLS